MGADGIGDISGSLARGVATCGVRLGAHDACGLISRCGHHGLPVQKLNRNKGRNPACA
jgi:hypothetical protein